MSRQRKKSESVARPMLQYDKRKLVIVPSVFVCQDEMWQAVDEKRYY